MLPTDLTIDDDVFDGSNHFNVKFSYGHDGIISVNNFLEVSKSNYIQPILKSGNSSNIKNYRH